VLGKTCTSRPRSLLSVQSLYWYRCSGQGLQLVQQGAFILWRISKICENVVTIAAAGAIPLLVQLLKPGTPADGGGLVLQRNMKRGRRVASKQVGAVPHEEGRARGK
jgi:hypothetical protein